MINSNSIKVLQHIKNPVDTFGNGVEIKGGISYMLIDSTEKTNFCLFNGEKRQLSKYDIIITEKSSILEKVINEIGIDTICIGRGDNVFGIETNDKRVDFGGDIVCYMSQQKGFKRTINSKTIKKSPFLEKWKVITAESSGSNKNLGKFGNKFIGKPNEVYSGSYIAFVLDSEKECQSLLSYLDAKFANYLLSLRKISQHIKPDTCKWIPMVPFDREWTDEQLFDYFNLTEEERNIILNYDKNYS